MNRIEGTVYGTQTGRARTGGGQEFRLAVLIGNKVIVFKNPDDKDWPVGTKVWVSVEKQNGN